MKMNSIHYYFVSIFLFVPEDGYGFCSQVIVEKKKNENGIGKIIMNCLTQE